MIDNRGDELVLTDGPFVESKGVPLIFTCCHPALAPEARVALTLRMVGGLTWPRSPAHSSCRRAPQGIETDPLRHDLTAEAIRLARLMRGLLPDDGEVAGLLALMPRSSPMGTGSCARDSPPALRPAGPCGFQGSQRRLAGGQEGEQHAPGQAKRAGGRSGWLGQPSRSANPIRMPSGPRT